ncbi:hypothetical protein Tco_0746538 [Tanacetum coccineum]
MDDLGGVTHDEESDSYARQDGCVAQLQSNHDEMAEFVENVKKILPRLATPTPDAKATSAPDENEGPNAKEDPSDATIDVEHMDVVGNHEENEGPNANLATQSSFCLLASAFNTNEFLNNSRPEMHRATPDLCGFA